MKPATILLSRHGQTSWNRDGNRYCGSTDIDLSPLGYEQAQRLAAALRDTQLAAVYASTASRAQVTAAPTATQRGLSVIVDAGLRETDFGEFEGCTPENLASMRTEEFQAWRRDPEGTPPPGGETVMAATERAMESLARIAKEHAGENVLVVAHNTLNRLVLCRIMGAPARNYRRILQNNACINTLLWGDDIQLVSANQTMHLRGGTQ